jgi:C-terminal processing protease CtpA/Prc
MQSKNRTLRFVFLNCCAVALILNFGLLVLPTAIQAQSFGSLDRERGQMMLDTIKDELKKNYYDPNFHGMNLDTRFKEADAKIKQSTSMGQMLGLIAQVLIELNDSHTFFLPPGRSYRTDYGWLMQMVGDKCYIVGVKPGSNAEALGVRPGDEIYSIDGFGPSRDNMWKIQYSYNALRPRPAVRLVVIKPDGQEKELEVQAKIDKMKRVINLSGDDDGFDIWELDRQEQAEARLNRHRYTELGKDLLVWKMPAFDLEDSQVDSMVAKFKKRQGVIFDLRGNGGGYEQTLLRLLGHLFDHDVKLGEVKRRKETKPVTAKTRGNDAFAGKVVVLIDSDSGSAAELFARVIQLEKRGVVIGDRSAGAVMRAIHHPHQLGTDTVIPYSVSITDSDLFMTDGKSLEQVGVTPDETKLPQPSDLAAKRDPVLAYAITLLGGTTTPEVAGAMFPREWRK